MQQMGEWVAKLGLADYTSCFAENRIDFTVLPDLTDQDLKERTFMRPCRGRKELGER